MTARVASRVRSEPICEPIVSSCVLTAPDSGKAFLTVSSMALAIVG